MDVPWTAYGFVVLTVIIAALVSDRGVRVLSRMVDGWPL